MLEDPGSLMIKGSVGNLELEVGVSGSAAYGALVTGGHRQVTGGLQTGGALQDHLWSH